MAQGHTKEPTFKDFQALAALLTEHGLKAEAFVAKDSARYGVQVGSPTGALIWAAEEHGVWRYAVSHEGGQYLRSYGIECLPGIWDKGLELVLDI